MKSRWYIYLMKKVDYFKQLANAIIKIIIIFYILIFYIYYSIL